MLSSLVRKKIYFAHQHDNVYFYVVGVYCEELAGPSINHVMLVSHSFVMIVH
jgi:hypothetical protein